MSFLTFPLHAFTGCLLRIHVICKSLNRNWLSNPTWESSNWLSQKEKLEMNAWLISLICSISLICYRWKSLTIPSTPSKLKCGILVWDIKKKYWKWLSPGPFPSPKKEHQSKIESRSFDHWGISSIGGAPALHVHAGVTGRGARTLKVLHNSIEEQLFSWKGSIFVNLLSQAWHCSATG